LVGNFQVGKKKRSTQAVDSLSKRFLDGEVAQQGEVITNHNRIKKRSTQAVDSLSRRFLDGKVAQQGGVITNQNGMKKRSTQAVDSLSKRFLDGRLISTPVPFLFDANRIKKSDWVNDFFADRPFSMKHGDMIAVKI